jgi:integrase
MNTFLTAELRLVKAVAGIELVKKDQPFLYCWWKDRVDMFEEPTIYLAEQCVGCSPSKHTWEAVGYDLLSWFQWCQLKKIDWRDATEQDRKQFRDDYEAASSEATTINRKLSTVRRFYDFCRAEGWYHRDIGSALEAWHVPSRAIDDDALAHTRLVAGRVVGRDPVLLKAGRKDVIKPLQVRALRQLLEHVGPTSSDAADTRSVRDRLICDLGWMCGARLGDVVKFTTLQFLSITVQPHEQMHGFPLIVEGKGKVTRRVSVPGWLVLAVQSYISQERAVSEREGKKRGARLNSTALFLGHPGSKSAGKPITRSAIQKMFAAACMACGITERIEVVDVMTGEKHVRIVPAHSFHDLRHDCAVLTYHAERALGNAEPWKIVQIKLGHKSLKITMDTYLAHVSIFGEIEGITDIRRLIGIQR